jgi:hypothetical protein
MANCTVANNQAASGLNLSLAGGRTISAGGGVYSLGELSLTNCTVSGNSITSVAQGTAVALSQGGGVCINPASAHGGQLVNTIVAGNSSDQLGPDVFGSFASLGNNLIGATNDSSGWISTDLTGTKDNPLNPLLGSLQNNGGPTQTMALLPGSPAIDAGDINYAPGPYDQRGDGFPRIVNGTIDIGAFEVQSGGDALARPPKGGARVGQLLPVQSEIGLISAVSPGEHAAVMELTAQQPARENAPSDVRQENRVIHERAALDTLFAAELDHGRDIDLHALVASTLLPDI